MMTLERVIELLKEEYEKAKRLEFVKNPLAYSLYRVWRIVDKESAE